MLVATAKHFDPTGTGCRERIYMHLTALVLPALTLLTSRLRLQRRFLYPMIGSFRVALLVSMWKFGSLKGLPGSEDEKAQNC